MRKLRFSIPRLPSWQAYSNTWYVFGPRTKAPAVFQGFVYTFGSSSVTSIAIVSGSTGVKRSMTRSRSEEHTPELQSRPHLVCRLLLDKKKHTDAGPLSGPESTHST